VAEALEVSEERVVQWVEEACNFLIIEQMDEGGEREPDSEELSEDPVREIDPREVVAVRIVCDRGLLAGRAVWRNEVHWVLYREYLNAVRVNPGGYKLVR